VKYRGARSLADQKFYSELWEQDLVELPDDQKPLALEILKYVRDGLRGIPYHRASKASNKSDRQTLIKHPQTGFVCLVISVVSEQAVSANYSLRLDFFDKLKTISLNDIKITEAPRTQWTTKGERRFFVSGKVPLERLKRILSDIWNIQ
jgi:hypothetical protein